MAEDTLTQKALEKIASLEAEVLKLKIFINEADKLNGNEPRFGNVDAASPSLAGIIAAARWKAGDFFGKSFAGAVRQVLLSRLDQSGSPSPASVDDIHEALTQGSFDFGTAGIDAQKNSIRISLGKNSAQFVRLPNSDLFGLVEWYGGRKMKARKQALPVDEPDFEGDEDADEAAVDGHEEPKVA